MQPLALRMRPETIDDIIGQEHITGPQSLLRKMTESSVLSSVILYGPPGTGKTTIAAVIAKHTHADFQTINAVAAGKKDIEKVIKLAEKNQTEENKDTILFIDEIHRFNKAQQDYLLPYVERGTVTLIGATTENPYFEINPAIVSRSVVFELKPIEPADIRIALTRALDKDDILKSYQKTVPEETLLLLSEAAGGDIRHGLQLLEIAVMTEKSDTVKPETVKEIIRTPHMRYDKNGDSHYDTISAFIKSMRGSDPDGVLYYLAKMILSGEDPKFIARRIMICASEDVGNADPQALVLATSASMAVERIGMPEGRIILAQAALYVAMAPKSNTAICGIDDAIHYLKKRPSDAIPNHLKDAHYKSAAKLGHGTEYLYPHDYPYHWCPQQYLPDNVKEKRFYRNSHNGYEETQANYLNQTIHKFYADKIASKK